METVKLQPQEMDTIALAMGTLKASLKRRIATENNGEIKHVLQNQYAAADTLEMMFKHKPRNAK